MISRDEIQKEKSNLYAFRNDEAELSSKEYFLTFKNVLPSSVRFQNIDASITGKLLEEGWEAFIYDETFTEKDNNGLVTDTLSDELEMGFHEKSNTYWLKGDFFLQVALHSRGKRCGVVLSFPYDMPRAEVNEQVNFISFFIDKSQDSKFFILIKEEYGLNIRDFKVKVPKNINLELNYGEGFADAHETIKAKLSTESSGLFIFHGCPGSGKSTYIKKLAEDIPTKKFVYIPEFMISMLNNPEMISLFIEHQNSVLVIEDAEKIIMSRESDESSLVSIILNLSDGILSDILKIPVILTYNTKTENIDEALLRKGRLKYKHEFKALTADNVVKILKANGASDSEILFLESEHKIKDDMSIADVFFLTDDIGEIVKPEKVSLGFAS